MVEKATKQNSVKWWHGVLFYVGVQVAGWGLRIAVRRLSRTHHGRGDRRFYERQRLPLFAPPGVAFPIAWTVNSASSIAGAIRVLNRGEHGPERRRFLFLQSAAWLLFAIFNTAYFELRSPVNAAAVTLAGVTLASIRSALRMRKGQAVYFLAPTALWLTLATPVAITVAAWNRDEFWNVGPIAVPPQALTK